MDKRSIALVLVFLAGACILFWSQTNPGPQTGISVSIVQQHGRQDVLISFTGIQDWSAIQHRTKEEKGHYVYQALKQTSEVQQLRVIDLLNDWDIHYQSFCIANTILAKLSSAQIERIALIPEVLRITPNGVIMMEQPILVKEGAQRTEGIEWGLERIGADDVWAMGFFGQGVLVGGEDTGYDWRHPALSTAYRGNQSDTVNHSYHWHDAIHDINLLHQDSVILPENNPCGLDVMEPCDDNGHGSHTMGTMVGSHDTDTIGVAPGATWIACRNMERGYGSPATYIECLEWFLAPTDLNGNNPDPTKAPHVINNSWSCPTMEGCHPENYGLLQTAIANLKAAGVVVVTSAGNSGPGCGSVATPPGMFEESFVAGATNINDTIAGFSSRGPVMIDSSGRLKPNIAAPGVGVRSAWLNGSYIFANGTSMAAPHVAGTVALMISANPDLAGQVELIEDIIESTAIHLSTTQECGGITGAELPNHTYGYGRIDALAAVKKALALTEVREIQESVEIVVYPNPAAEYITIGKDSNIRYEHMKIIASDGRLIKVLESRQFPIVVSLESLEPGVYFVTGHTGTQYLVAKFVKL